MANPTSMQPSEWRQPTCPKTGRVLGLMCMASLAPSSSAGPQPAGGFQGPMLSQSITKLCRRTRATGCKLCLYMFVYFIIFYYTHFILFYYILIYFIILYFCICIFFYIFLYFCYFLFFMFFFYLCRPYCAKLCRLACREESDCFQPLLRLLLPGPPDNAFQEEVREGLGLSLAGDNDHQKFSIRCSWWHQSATSPQLRGFNLPGDRN